MTIDQNIYDVEDEILNTKASDLIYYLISLYYKTNCKYRIGRDKVCELLTIYQLIIMRIFYTEYNYNSKEEEFKFNEYLQRFILTPNNQGLHFMVDRDCYFDALPDQSNYIVDIIDHSITVPYIYEKLKTKELSGFSKSLIEEIFRNFGNYPTHNSDKKGLAQMLNQITDKMQEQGVIINNEININGLKDFFNNQDNKILFYNNEIFSFIENHKVKYVSPNQDLTNEMELSYQDAFPKKNQMIKSQEEIARAGEIKTKKYNIKKLYDKFKA